jgi:integrase/recombinase XerD
MEHYGDRMTDITTPSAPLPTDPTKLPSVMERLADIPEEEIWLQKQKSARTRRAYRLDVRHFMAILGIATSDELRQVDHRAVIAWERFMREVERVAPSTIRRPLSALSSLFKHLVRHISARAANPSRVGALSIRIRRKGEFRS